MKRLVAVLIVVLVIMSLSVYAFAENVPSPVPSVVLEKYVAVSGSTFPSDFIIEVVEPEEYSENILTLYSKIDSIMKTGDNVSAIFTQEELDKMAAMLPEEVDIVGINITEYIPLNIFGVYEGIGDVEATFILPGEYFDDEVLVSMLGILDDVESVVWVPVSTKVVDGKIVINFAEDTLMEIGDKETVLAVLRVK